MRRPPPQPPHVHRALNRPRRSGSSCQPGSDSGKVLGQGLVDHGDLCVVGLGKESAALQRDSHRSEEVQGSSMDLSDRIPTSGVIFARQTQTWMQTGSARFARASLERNWRQRPLQLQAYACSLSEPVEERAGRLPIVPAAQQRDVQRENVVCSKARILGQKNRDVRTRSVAPPARQMPAPLRRRLEPRLICCAAIRRETSRLLHHEVQVRPRSDAVRRGGQTATHKGRTTPGQTASPANRG